jgi:hypothetical protein
MKTYEICKFNAYCNICGTDTQYAVYEDIEGKSCYMIALFASENDALEYVDKKNTEIEKI